MLNFKNRKYWFTLAEIIILCSLFSFLILWVITAINKSFAFLNNTKIAVRAANFAREWMEMMYNIRDTNWRKNSWDRDNHRADWFKYFGNSPYFYLEENSTDHSIEAKSLSDWSNACEDIYNGVYEDVDGFFGIIDWSDTCSIDLKKSEMEFNWNYVYYDENGVQQIWNLNDLLKGWTEFYRIVRIYGFYNKDSDRNDDRLTFERDIINWTPVEMRFCVKVFYRNGQWKHATELCGLMTNFTE